MAGIGFRLEKILSKNSYINLLEGYAYSAIVSAGPMLCTIFSVAVLNIIAMGSLNQNEATIFRTLIVYVYAFSLITSSPFQMVITRYMADRIFLKDYQAIIPSFVGITIISTIINAGIGYVAVQYLGVDIATAITAVVLFVIIGIIWIAMIALSAAKEFLHIIRSFFIGSLVSIGAGYWLGTYYGLIGLLSGFTIGQTLLAILLLVQLFTEFSYRNRVEFYFLEYFRKYTSLAFIAAFYNIGIWADKFTFWFTAETGERVHKFLFCSPVYDTPLFLAYLFIVPSLAMFTIRIETSFYMHYRKYFLSILNKHPFSSLQERQQNIINDLKLSIGRMIVLQGTITILGVFLAPKIYNYLGMSSINLGVFQIAIVATFMQALLQTLLIMMLYFDFRTDALLMSMLFAVSNTLFSMKSIEMGFSYYGYGYFLSCFVTLFFGFLLFNYRLKNLLFYTFTSQKIIIHEAVS